MKIFEQVTSENTPIALKLALDRAKEMETDIVLSSSTGASALARMEHDETEIRGI